MLQLSLGTRVRRSPFFDATIADGVTHFSTYNHMYMPTGYGDPQAEYWRLIEGVSMWDVAVERQIELFGPDAERLAQDLCPRHIGKMQPGQGRYVAVCDHRGVLINDPVIMKHAEDRIWLSIADSDVLRWARAIAAERRYDVLVWEPDISPLAIQGPKAGAVAGALLGGWVNDLRHFWFREVELEGIPITVARSGWSKQGGFELYLQDATRGVELWNLVKEAGAPFDIGPGTPNPSERIESGLLSFGADTDDETNPFEVRMERFVDLDVPDRTIGIHALRQVHDNGPRRHQLGIVIDHEPPITTIDRWYALRLGITFIGNITAMAWSPRLGCNVGMCLVWKGAEPGETVTFTLPDGTTCEGELRTFPLV